jgi:hypothetical protein
MKFLRIINGFKKRKKWTQRFYKKQVRISQEIAVIRKLLSSFDSKNFNFMFYFRFFRFLIGIADYKI